MASNFSPFGYGIAAAQVSMESPPSCHAAELRECSRRGCERKYPALHKPLCCSACERGSQGHTKRCSKYQKHMNDAMPGLRMGVHVHYPRMLQDFRRWPFDLLLGVHSRTSEHAHQTLPARQPSWHFIQKPGASIETSAGISGCHARATLTGHCTKGLRCKCE